MSPLDPRSPPRWPETEARVFPLPALDSRRPGPRGTLSRRRFKPRPAGCSPSTAYNGPDRSNDGGTHGYSRWVQPSTWTGRTLRAATSRLQPLLRGVRPLKRPPERSGAAGNRVQTLPSRASPSAVQARSRWPRGRFPGPDVPGLAPQFPSFFSKSARNRSFKPCATGCNSSTLSASCCNSRTRV